MKKVKGFGDFTDEQLLEKLSIGKYQRAIQKFYKESDIELYNASRYTTSLTVLIQFVEKLMQHGRFGIDATIDNATMLTIFAISILSSEAKNKTGYLYEFLKDKGIDDGDMDSILNQLKNTKEIFRIILKQSNKEIKSIEDMLEFTSMLVPYITVMKNLVENELLNSYFFSLPFDEFKKVVTKIGFKMLIIRILHKLNIITTSTNKFQNKDNAKPLKINDELKSPLLKSEDTILEKNRIRRR